MPNQYQCCFIYITSETKLVQINDHKPIIIIFFIFFKWDWRISVVTLFFLGMFGVVLGRRQESVVRRNRWCLRRHCFNLGDVSFSWGIITQWWIVLESFRLHIQRLCWRSWRPVRDEGSDWLVRHSRSHSGEKKNRICGNENGLSLKIFMIN